MKISKLCNAILAAAIAFTPMSPSYAATQEIKASPGEFLYRYKMGSDTYVPDDTQTKSITAFFVGGVNMPFSERLPVKPDWEDDDWRVVSGTLPAGLSFDPATMTFSGTPELVGLATVVELEGIDSNGNSVGKTVASFDIRDMEGLPVKVNAYAHTNKYRLVELAIPNGVTVSDWTQSKAPPGISASGPYFEGTPTEEGITPIFLEGKDFLGNTVVTFYGTYIVEDGPVFPFVKDDIRELGTAPITISMTKSAPAIRYSIGKPSQVRYYYELEAGDKLPGNMVSNGGTQALSLSGYISKPYQQATARWKAIDSDGTVGYSNWFTFGSGDPSPECKLGDAAPSFAFTTGKDWNAKLWGVIGAKGTLSYTVVAGELPAPLALNPTTGRVTGKPTQTAFERRVTVRIDVTNGQNVVSSECDYRISVVPGNFGLTDDTKAQARYVRTGDTYQGVLKVSGGIQNYSVAFDNATPTFAFSTPNTNSATVGVTGIVDTVGTIQIPFTATNEDGNTDQANLTIYGRGPLAVDPVGDFSVKRLAASQVWKAVSFDPLTVIPDASGNTAQPRFTLNSLNPQKPLPEGVVFDTTSGEFTGIDRAPADVYGPFTVAISDFSGQTSAPSAPFTITVTKRDDLELSLNTLSPFYVERPAPQERAVVTAVQPPGAAKFKIAYSLNGPVPQWLTIDPDTGLLTVAANVPYEDIDTYGPFTVSATDGESNAESDPFSIEIRDILSPSARTADKIASNVTGDVAKGETPIFVSTQNLKNYIDKNTIIGTTDEVTLLSAEPSSPAGLVFDANAGTLSGPPTSEFNGIVTVRFKDKKNREGTIQLPVEVKPYPVIEMTNLAYEIPRLAEVSALPTTITGRQVSGFWNKATWSLVGTLPSKLTVDASSGTVKGATDDAIGTVATDLRLRAVSVSGDGVTRLESFTPPFSVAVRKPSDIGLSYAPTTETIFMTEAGSALSYVSRTAAVPSTSGSYVGPLIYSLDQSQARADGMGGSIGINGSTGRLTGSADTLGIWTVYVTVTDQEGRSNGSPVPVTIKSTLSGDINASGGGTFLLRQFEPFKTDPLSASNYVGSVKFAATPALLAQSMDFLSTTGNFSDRSVIDTVVTNYAVQVDAKDDHGRSFAAPLQFRFTTLGPLKVTVPAAKRAISSRQYSAVTTDVIDASFGPSATNRIGDITYDIGGDLPGTLVKAKYDPDQTVLLSYGWIDEASKSNVLSVTPDNRVTGWTLDGVPQALYVDSTTGQTIEAVKPYLPLDALVFDPKAVTLKGIPSRSGTFTATITARDDHMDDYLYPVATQTSYNSAASEEITIVVAPATSLATANFVSGEPGDYETINRYTSQPSVTTTLENSAYGMGIASMQMVGNPVPDGVKWTHSGATVSYHDYATELGVFDGIVAKLRDYAGREIDADPLTFEVVPRKPLELVATNPAMLVVDEPGSVTVTARNTAYGTPISAQDWTVTGVSNLPPGMTHTISAGRVTFEGTPTVIANYSGIRVTGVDALGASASVDLAIRVTASSDPIILNVTDITAKEGYPFEMQATSSNTYGTVRYYSQDIDGQYADDLRIDGTSGLVSGQFDTPLTTDFDVYVTDDTNRITTKPVVVTVLPKMRLTVPSIVAAEAYSNVNRSITTDYAIGTVQYRKGAGDWPDGFSVNPDTGAIVATNVLVELKDYPGLTIEATDTFGNNFTDQATSNVFTIRAEANGPYVRLIESVLPDAVKRIEVYSQDIAINPYADIRNAAATDFTWVMSAVSANGEKVPPGLKIANGVISGTPTLSGDYTFRVTATSKTNAKVFSSALYTLKVTLPQVKLDVIASALTDAEFRKAYTETLTPYVDLDNIPAASLTWKIEAIGVGQALPAGLAINGLTLKGTPTKSKEYKFTLTATFKDATDENYSDSAEFTLKVQGNGFTYLGMGAYTVCGVTAKGETKCWGEGTYGRLGNGATTDKSNPTLVTGHGEDTNITGIAGGRYHNCFLTKSATVECTGYNTNAQIGDGTTTTQRLTPVAVVGLSNVVQVESNYYSTCALKSDGTIWCWGYNAVGQLGDGTTTTRRSPVKVNLDEPATQIAVGYAHACALTTSGALKCWGHNTTGQFGVGTAYASSLTPVEANISALGGTPAKIRAGYGTTCAVTQSGTAWCWGRNAEGQLGDGTKTDRYLPVIAGGIAGGVQDVQSMYLHTCVLRTGGSLQCWGNNDYGQLGNNSTVTTTSPITVPGIEDAEQIVTGWYETCALRSDGSAWCWGYGTNGGLGNGALNHMYYPVKVN